MLSFIKRKRNGIYNMKNKFLIVFKNLKYLKQIINIKKNIVLKIWVILLVASAIISPIITLLYKLLIDAYNKKLGINYTGLFIISYVLFEFILEFVEDVEMYFALKLNYSITDNLLKKINAKLSKISIIQYENKEVYDLIERVKNKITTETLSSFGTIISIATLLVSILSNIIIIGSIRFYFPLLIIITSIPFLIVLKGNSKDKYGLHTELNALNRQVNYINGVLTKRDDAKEVRIFNLLDYLIDKSQNYRNKMYKKQNLLNCKYAIKSFVSNLLQYSSFGFCMIITCLGYIRGIFTIGDVMLAFTTIQIVVSQVSSILISVASVYDFTYNFNDWVTFLDLPEEDLTNMIVEENDIDLKNISFKYPGSSNFILQEINIKIKENEKIAIVGENGSGKSTLVNLILGIYKPTTGNILIGKKDLSSVLDDFRKKTICIFQKFNKYQISLKDNIIVGNEGKLAKEKVLDYNGFLSFVNNLPDKENTVLGQIYNGGVELSGGQWQRIAIERGLYRSNARFLIMDEPIASVDSTLENDFYERFGEISNNKTAILISHRLSAARLCDRIIVLENGKIIEEGNHDELIQMHGKYYRMFCCQKDLYLKK